MRAEGTSISLADAAESARTGDIWFFRGHTIADRAIRVATNAPVNHVAMAVVLDDLPPLMWHAELGKSVYDVWAGTHHRGVQLHDLRAAVDQWTGRYAQRAWLRQLSPEVDRAHEDALLRVIARWDGMPFPSTARLAGRWLRGRAGKLSDRRGWRLPRRRGGLAPEPMDAREAYCAEVVAVTYEEMGLLDNGMPTSFYDPGLFWSGDELRLSRGFTLGEEIAVAT